MRADKLYQQLDEVKLASQKNFAVASSQFKNHAPVAQLDRVSGFEPGGREFESLRARQIKYLAAKYRSLD